MNDAGQRLLEINDRTKNTNKPLLEFWEGDDRDAALAALEAAKAGDIGKFVGLCPTTGGQAKWWDVQVTPMLDTQGYSRRLLAISRDITAYKQVQESLRSSEERLEHVIRGSHDGFWDGHVLPGHPWYAPITPVWWSPRVREMLGYNEEEVPDILDSWASRLHPDDRAEVFARLTACMELGISHYDVEYRLLNKHHDYQWFHARAEVVQRDAKGRAVRMAGALQDITDRKRTEARLRLAHHVRRRRRGMEARRNPSHLAAFRGARTRTRTRHRAQPASPARRLHSREFRPRRLHAARAAGPAVVVRGHRRGIPIKELKSIPARAATAAQRLTVLLRLAALLHRSRVDERVPKLAIEGDEDSLRLSLPERWLQSHPLTETDLAQEREHLAAIDFKLVLRTL